MTRTIVGLGLVIGLPVAAAAQSAPPPRPPVPPAPVVQAPPAPPVPAQPPRGVAPAPLLPDFVMPEIVMPDFVMPDFDFDLEAIRHAAEAARLSADALRFQEHVTWPPLDWPDADFHLAQIAVAPRRTQSSDSSDYNSGLSYLNRRNYEQAVARFDRAIARQGSHNDGALYWKAFAQYKLGQMDDALATLGTLRQNHAQSRYLGDAKMLEAEVRRMSGQTLTADQIANMDDDEIKLLAIDGIRRSNPEGAIPLLEGLLNAASSLPVKRRALYVLALSDQPRAREVLLSYAKGAGNPDLQMEAIRYVAANRDHPNVSSDLRQIYESTDDQSVRLAVIQAYRAAGDKSALISLVSMSSEPVTLRRQAVSGLTGIATPQDLWAIYQKEPDADLRVAIVSAFGSMGAIEQLNQVIRTEKDPTVRQRAVRTLGARKSDDTGQVLIDLYSRETDTATRKAVIAALAQQNNAEGLVAIARQEASLELKKEIVSKLSAMASRSKVAADYLLEIIK